MKYALQHFKYVYRNMLLHVCMLVILNTPTQSSFAYIFPYVVINQHKKNEPEYCLGGE